jgi:dTMP kinase
MGPDAGRGAGAGILISLEGVEGSGKSTQCRLLLAWLRDQGVAVTTVREPGGTDLGERLRAIVLDPALGPLRPETEVLLFAAARSQALVERIEPALSRGDVVVCDRFVDSSAAYQGAGLGVDAEFIRRVNDAVTQGLRPQLTILLDVPAGVGRERRRQAAAELDRIERRDIAYHEAVRTGYLALARREPGRFMVVDGTGDPETVHDAIQGAVARALASRATGGRG